MSRIHDALKRAEEQRLTNLGFSPDAALEQKTELYTPPEPNQVEPDVAPSRSAAENVDRPLDDHLLRNRPTAHWSPSKDALFLSTKDANAPGLEEFRSLRSKLFQFRTEQPLKTILVSSALPAEGKSFVAANLAQAFARQRGGRTLVIDADLRKPHMHEILGAPSSPGLYEYLASRASESEIIQKSEHDDLFFIPAGNVTSTAAELIGNGRVKLLLERLGPLFNWIIMDSSPVVPVSDATRLAELADGVLLVLRSGSTPHIMAERAKKELQHGPVLGVVFNQVPFKENPYYKYSYSAQRS